MGGIVAVIHGHAGEQILKTLFGQQVAVRQRRLAEFR